MLRRLKFFSFLVSFSFLLGVDLCTIDSILPAGALVLVVWWGGGLFVRVLGVLQFRFSFCSCFCFVCLFFFCFLLLFPFLLLIRWLQEKSSNLFDNL